MKGKLVATVALCMSLAGDVSAHRLNEYLQATLFTIEEGRVQASMRLIPGVDVSSAVLTKIDSNADGSISATEQRGYAERVLRDLSLRSNDKELQLQLVSLSFPELRELQDGTGEIHLEFTADLPDREPSQTLVFENHHLNRIAAYLVNCLVPRDPQIRIGRQDRNQSQSFYQLNYTQARATGEMPPLAWVSYVGEWLRSATDNAPFWLHGFGGMFRLGMHHIAEGTDHLLFLLTLLLPAPLLAVGWSWTGFAGVRHSAVQILKVVTAFTVGHSITLALAAWGAVHVPSRPIEVIIAFSILVSAIHALRPVFPGCEAGIAAIFGLVHGLAFATTLSQLGLARWERITSIVSFNLGIETTQLIVVAATMPSLVLLARTRSYAVLRVGGASFAALASLGWIAERLLKVHSPVDIAVNAVLRHAVWIALALFLAALTGWCMRERLLQKAAGHLKRLTRSNMNVPRPVSIPNGASTDGCRTDLR